MSGIHSELRKQQAVRFKNALNYFVHDLQEAINTGELPASIDVESCAQRLLSNSIGLCTLTLHLERLYTRAYMLQEVDFMLQNLVTDPVLLVDSFTQDSTSFLQ